MDKGAILLTPIEDLCAVVLSIAGSLQLHTAGASGPAIVVRERIYVPF